MGRGNSLGPWRLSDLCYVGLIAVWVLGLAVLPSQTFATTASTQVVSASQENCALDSDPAATVHLEIQAAIQAALAIEGDDRILICPGIYVERVSVNDPLAHIDFIGVGDKSQIVIQAPHGSAGPIFQVLQAAHVSLSNVTVDGQSQLLPDAPGGVVEGILLINTYASVQGVMVQNIGSPDGNSQGICIRMQSNDDPVQTQHDDSVQMFEITDNSLSHCTRVAVLADGVGVVAEVHRNTIVGPLGPHAFALNGIQFSRGAKGSITYNAIDALTFPVPTVGGSSGIIMFCVDEATHIEANKITGTDIGATVADSRNVTVTSNELVSNLINVLLQTIGFYYGDPACPNGSLPPTHNTIASNKLLESINTGIDVNTLDPHVGVPAFNDITGNAIQEQGFFGILVRQGENNNFVDNTVVDGSAPDIIDQSVGNETTMGTSGTANFYTNNLCTNGSIPAGLCAPIAAPTSLLTVRTEPTSTAAPVQLPGSPF